jgi:hypothetical protein
MLNFKAMIFGVASVLLGGAAALAQPAAPSNLVAQAVRSDRVNLLFQDNSNNETGFEIEARASANPTFSSVGTVGPNVTALSVTTLNPGTTYLFRVRAVNGAGNSAYSNVASATTLTSDGPCVASPNAMCLNSDRFRVQALFLTGAGQGGEARMVKLTADSGYSWFFDSDNIEGVIKVLNGCGVNSRYWVFAAGLTNVKVLLTVTDSATASTTTYFNPQGVPFQPLQDTGAFSTCP